jgi:MFS transporter, DHA1 family, multidrug resistance protein
VRLSPNGFGFALLLGALAALPSFGIDMSLPALGATGASLGVSADEAGLTISLFMIGYGIAPPLCGPVSDRIGRRPVMLGAVAVFAVASFGCAASPSLSTLLAWRVAQGMGAGVASTLTLAIMNDSFAGAAGRTMMSRLASLMLFVPMLAPAAGTAVLAVGDWRSIFAVLAGFGAVLLGVVWRRLGESARLEAAERLRPTTILRAYGAALRHPVCVGFILVNAAAFGAFFAYISGSSLYLIGGLGLSRGQYSLIYAASFAGVLASVLLNGRLSARGVAPEYPLKTGITLALGSAIAFAAAILAGYAWVPALVGILVVGTMGFGLIVPNAMHAAMQPLPSHAGAVSAMMGFVQVLAQSASSAAVVALDGRTPGLSMAVTMVFWSVVALLVYVRVARPAECFATEKSVASA